MSFHEINFHRSRSAGAYLAEPPVTLPVQHDDAKIALAVYRQPNYQFSLPDVYSRRIESGELKPAFVYSGVGNPASFEYQEGFTLSSITLVLAADYELDLLRV